MINNLLLYFQFLTRVPINKSLDCSMENFKKGIYGFVLVGAFLGGVNTFLYYIMRGIFSNTITAGVLVIVPILLTGGMQIDGIGDTCDGFFAFKEGGKEKRIEIMKDSRVGTFAVIAIIWLMVMKINIISELISDGKIYGIFMFTVLSRFCVMFQAYIGKKAKEHGTGNLYIQNVGSRGLFSGLTLTLIFALISGGIFETVLILPIIMIITMVFNKYCEKKIGGQSGDTLGATNEICELAALMVMAAI